MKKDLLVLGKNGFKYLISDEKINVLILKQRCSSYIVTNLENSFRRNYGFTLNFHHYYFLEKIVDVMYPRLYTFFKYKTSNLKLFNNNLPISNHCN